MDKFTENHNKHSVDSLIKLDTESASQVCTECEAERERIITLRREVLDAVLVYVVARMKKDKKKNINIGYLIDIFEEAKKA